MRIDRRWFVALAILLLPLVVVGKAYGETRYRWDITHITFSPSGNVIDVGGKGSAIA